MAGFLYLLVFRKDPLIGLLVATGIALSGTLIYLIRARFLRQWPFAQPTESLEPQKARIKNELSS
jgi:hypothetical protein